MPGLLQRLFSHKPQPVLAQAERAAIVHLQTQKVGAIRKERQRILHERLRGYVDSQKGAT